MRAKKGFFFGSKARIKRNQHSLRIRPTHQSIVPFTEVEKVEFTAITEAAFPLVETLNKEVQGTIAPLDTRSSPILRALIWSALDIRRHRNGPLWRALLTMADVDQVMSVLLKSHKHRIKLNRPASRCQGPDFAYEEMPKLKLDNLSLSSNDMLERYVHFEKGGDRELFAFISNETGQMLMVEAGGAKTMEHLRRVAYYTQGAIMLAATLTTRKDQIGDSIAHSLWSVLHALYGEIHVACMDKKRAWRVLHDLFTRLSNDDTESSAEKSVCAFLEFIEPKKRAEREQIADLVCHLIGARNDDRARAKGHRHSRRRSALNHELPARNADQDWMNNDKRRDDDLEDAPSRPRPKMVDAGTQYDHHDDGVKRVKYTSGCLTDWTKIYGDLHEEEVVERRKREEERVKAKRRSWEAQYGDKYRSKMDKTPKNTVDDQNEEDVPSTSRRASHGSGQVKQKQPKTSANSKWTSSRKSCPIEAANKKGATVPKRRVANAESVTPTLQLDMDVADSTVTVRRKRGRPKKAVDTAAEDGATVPRDTVPRAGVPSETPAIGRVARKRAHTEVSAPRPTRAKRSVQVFDPTPNSPKHRPGSMHGEQNQQHFWTDDDGYYYGDGDDVMGENNDDGTEQVFGGENGADEECIAVSRIIHSDETDDIDVVSCEDDDEPPARLQPAHVAAAISPIEDQGEDDVEEIHEIIEDESAPDEAKFSLVVKTTADAHSGGHVVSTCKVEVKNEGADEVDQDRNMERLRMNQVISRLRTASFKLRAVQMPGKDEGDTVVGQKSTVLGEAKITVHEEAKNTVADENKSTVRGEAKNTLAGEDKSLVPEELKITIAELAKSTVAEQPKCTVADQAENTLVPVEMKITVAEHAKSTVAGQAENTVPVEAKSPVVAQAKSPGETSSGRRSNSKEPMDIPEVVMQPRFGTMRALQQQQNRQLPVQRALQALQALTPSSPISSSSSVSSWSPGARASTAELATVPDRAPALSATVKEEEITMVEAQSDHDYAYRRPRSQCENGVEVFFVD